MRAAASNSTTAPATAGCALARTTSSRSATTPRKTWPSSGSRRRTGPTCDRYFSALMAETFPNRVYQMAAQTDRLDNSVAICALPTIWDRLAERGVESRYYFSDVPFLALWGAKYLPISRHVAGISRRVCDRQAAAGVVRRSAICRRRRRHAKRRPSARGHPRWAGVSRTQIYTRGGDEPGLDDARC